MGGGKYARPVRKHRAPKGALRLSGLNVDIATVNGQKAPNTKRCIKRLFRVECGWRHLDLLR